MLSNIIDRIRLPFRKEKEFCSALYDILGFYPHNITYYKVALMHKSIGHRATEKELKALDGKRGKRGKKLKKGEVGRRLNNERLEFLGDAILDAVVGDVVYRNFPGKPEGFLTNTRSKLVQRETLGKIAREMRLNKLILASSHNTTHNSYIGGNAFEALVGAIYLDRGYGACYDFWTERIMKRYLNVTKMAYKEMNFKSKILEWSQKNRIKMEFRLEEQSQDKNGSPKFVYSLYLEGIAGGTAEGFSKKESQQKACEITLKELRNNGRFLDSIFAAKAERTQMDENPAVAVPTLEVTKKEELSMGKQADETVTDLQYGTKASDKETQIQVEKDLNEMTFDDLSVKPQKVSMEDIIAKAEEEAYKQ